MSLGNKVRLYRNQKAISGAELARRVGVSRSLISQIETGSANPSLDTIQRIAHVLEIPLSLLFEDPVPPNSMIIKKDKRKIITQPKFDIVWEILTPDLNQSIEVLWIEIGPCRKRLMKPAYSHRGEEVIVVICGQLYLWINDAEIVLEEGDSVTFDSGQPHSFANLTDRKAIIISAITPPSF